MPTAARRAPAGAVRQPAIAVLALLLVVSGGAVSAAPRAVDAVASLTSPAAPPAGVTGPLGAEQVEAAYGSLPMRFEANHGQVDPEARFVLRGGGSTVYFTSTGAVLSLSKSEAEGPANASAEPGAPDVVRMSFASANPDLTVEGTERLPGVSNYLRGDNPAGWQTDVPGYAGVRYDGVYPGIDAVFHEAPQGLEYDFEVAPGADPGAIGLTFDGAGAPTLDPDGSLVLHPASGELRQSEPVLYQDFGEDRREVPGGFVVDGDRVGFWVGGYDTTRPLVIDPVLDYSTFLGGVGNGVAIDSTGHAYVTGTTQAFDFPTRDPLQPELAGEGDAFVTKLTPDGSALVYSTYLGGSRGDDARAIAVDSSGAVALSGSTSSTDFPVTAGAFQPACGDNGRCDGDATFTNGASTEGSPTYTRGPGQPFFNPNVDVGRTITGTNVPAGTTIIDVVNFSTITLSNNATGTGTDLTYTILERSPVPDAFVAKLSPGGSAVTYASYLGGSGTDAAAGVAIDPAGRIHVAGSTRSTDFPVSKALQATPGGGQDAFVAKFDPDASGPASLVYSTYLGGDANDGAGASQGVATDDAGSSFVVGSTSSTNFPTSSALQAIPGGGQDVFVAKITVDGSALEYSTYLGGTGSDTGNGIDVDASGAAYIAGGSSSTDFPTTAGAFQPTCVVAPGDRCNHAVVVKLAADGSAIDYSSYLGGDAATGFARANDVAADASGRAYVVGQTNSADLPVKEALLPYGGSFDGFVAQLDTTASGTASLLFSTHIGGTGLDLANAVAVDATGSAVVVGNAQSSDFPTEQPLRAACAPPGTRCRDGFVARILPGDSPALVNAVAPSSGLPSGGTPVVITGSDFTGTTGVSFGDVPAASFTVDSPTQITVVTPAQPEGIVDVTVTGPRGTSYANPFTQFTVGFGVWTRTDDLAAARTQHSATLLSGPSCGENCGKVLVAGGEAPFPNIDTAELYDPATGNWAPTGSMSRGRSQHTATLLSGPSCGENCGKVLVAGGRETLPEGDTGPRGSSELYDPATGEWEPTGAMTVLPTRESHTATLLDGPNCGANCGKVLVVGGRSPYTTSGQLYDPATGTWAATSGDLPFPWANHTATLISGPNCGDNCGKVIVAAGETSTGISIGNTAAAVLYDPVTDTFTATESMGAIRVFHSAVLLEGPNCGDNCGKVMVAGGSNFNSLTSIELFDPVAETWALVSVLSVPRFYHTATVLGSGKVLLAGGQNVDARGGIVSAELYDPATNDIAFAGLLNDPHTRVHTATLLLDGRVLVAAGAGPPTGGPADALNTAELYNPTPEITAITPASGPPGGAGEVTLTGSGFFGATAVLFGDVPATSFTVDSPTQITVVVPARSQGGSVPISVVTAGGPSIPSSTAVFVYLGLPGAITDLAGVAASPTQVNLSFSAPAANGTDPAPATDYVIKQSTTPITDQASFDAAPALCGGVCNFGPAEVGATITLSVTDLIPGTTYYYAVRAVSDGRTAPLSNIVSVTTPTIPTRVDLAFACPPDEITDSGFVDIEGNVHQRAIDCIAAHGITEGGPAGLPDDQYGPALDVRRDKMASLIVRMIDDIDAGLLPAADGSNAFNCDVDATNVHFQAIQRLARAGVVLG
ncbi:MAG: SBBP repeat-containing protein, partial [Acidimicrobiales bacterium]